MSEEPKPSSKYVMVESSPSIDEDEIDLLELIRTLLAAWKTIAIITILCTGLAFAYALSIPESFKAETLLASAEERSIRCIFEPKPVRWLGCHGWYFHAI